MSTNQLYAYDLTADGRHPAGPSLGTLVPGAKSTDCRAMCVGPTGDVVGGDHRGRIRRSARSCTWSATSRRRPARPWPGGDPQPGYTAMTDADGKPLPYHGGLIKLSDGTVTTRAVILGVCQARDGNVYILALQPYTLLQVAPEQLR